nr:hypothetical protein [Tanacetum cinerariifolium]
MEVARWCGGVAVIEMVMMAVGDGGGSGGVLTVAVEWGQRWWRRVVASSVVDRVDRVKGSIFGVRQKSSPKKFSDGGDGRRRPEVVVGDEDEGDGDGDDNDDIDGGADCGWRRRWWRRVVASGVVDLADTGGRSVFGVRRKSFPATTAVVARGGRRWLKGCRGGCDVEVVTRWRCRWWQWWLWTAAVE